MRRIFLASAGLLLCSAVTAQPITPSPACRDGLDALAVKDARGASAQLTQCLQLDLPNEVRAFILRSRARAYSLLDYPSAALEDQKASLKLSRPWDAWPLIDLAIYHRVMKQYPEALEAMKQATNYDENGPGSGPGAVVLYQTGVTLTLMGQHREAIEAFNKAISREPNFGHAFFARALAHESLLNRAQAKVDIAAAAEKLPASEYSRFMLAKFREYRVPIKPTPR